MNGLLEILERLGGERRIHYDLSYFQAALDSIGNPEKSVKSVVIAGTNGKGTTTLLCSAALQASGLRVGTYLSPHLQSVSERFLIEGKPAALSLLDSLALEYEGVADQHALTYFEFLTLIYFVLAQREQLDISVLEVGLGGRLDATNVTDPVGCILTTIGLDHQQFLGATEDAILSEKMGIFRKGVPVISAVTQPALRQRLAERCAELDCELSFSDSVSFKQVSRSIHGQQVEIDNHPFTLINPTDSFAQNAVTAYLFLGNVFPDISVSTIANAFAATSNPGRFEIVQENPRVILSGDHNPQGIHSLVRSVSVLRLQPLEILCAFSPDKPYAKMINSLRMISSSVTPTFVQALKDKMPPDYFKQEGLVPDAKQWIQAWLEAAPKDVTLLITGSLYLIGEVRSIWKSPAESFEIRQESVLPSYAARDASRPARFPPAATEQNLSP